MCATLCSSQTQELLVSQQWPVGIFPEEDDGAEASVGSVGMQSVHGDRRDSMTAASPAVESFKFKRGSALSRSGRFAYEWSVQQPGCMCATEHAVPRYTVGRVVYS